MPVSAERVFDMFTNPAELVRWIGISADLEPRPGGRFRFEVVPGQFCEGQVGASLARAPRRALMLAAGANGWPVPTAISSGRGAWGA